MSRSICICLVVVGESCNLSFYRLDSDQLATPRQTTDRPDSGNQDTRLGSISVPSVSSSTLEPAHEDLSILAKSPKLLEVDDRNLRYWHGWQLMYGCCQLYLGIREQ